MVSDKLSLKVKVGYGICDLGGNLFFSVIGFILLNFLTDTVGLAAGLAGIVVAVGKIWDAVTDPVTGYLSDRTRTRWGRRRPWMLFGSVPLFLAMILMFTNPGLESQSALFVWGVLSFCLLNTAYTAVNIPYNSLTPELTQDYHERTSLNAYRFSLAAIGTITALAATLPIIGLFQNRNTGFTFMGTLYGFIMMVTAMITVFSVREPGGERKMQRASFFKTYMKVFSNRPYVLILLTYALNILGITVIMGIAIYYFKYIHNNEPMTTLAMGILIVVAVIFIPISVAMAKRFGKKFTYGAGLAIYAVGIMLLFMVGHVLHINFSLGMMVFLGIGLGLTFAMPYAIIPDAVEYDYLRTGERTEGAFYGMWTFAIKIGQALSMAITGGVLSLVGYAPNVAQTELSQFGIRLLLGPITAGIFVLSILVLYFYPLTEKKYNRVLEEIKKMEDGGEYSTSI